MEQPPKKFSELYILRILMRYTDAEHTMTKKEIKEHLLKDYGLELDQKAITRNLKWLCLDDESHVFCSDDKTRIVKGKKQTIYTDYYYSQNFEIGELRFLVDSALYSAQIPSRQRTDLIQKIASCGNELFSTKIKHTFYTPKKSVTNGAFFLIVETLHHAIQNGRQVCFQYTSYDVDLKAKSRTDADGKPKQYQVSPYQLVMLNGRYYLICNYGIHDDLSNYRIDRIKNPKILQESTRPIKELTGEFSLDLAAYVKSHSMMWSGEEIYATIRTRRNMLNDIVDAFSLDVNVMKVEGDSITVRVHAGKEDIIHWAVQFAGDAVVESPQKVHDEIVRRLKEAIEQYNI